jgi:hypothetical protein
MKLEHGRQVINIFFTQITGPVYLEEQRILEFCVLKQPWYHPTLDIHLPLAECGARGVTEFRTSTFYKVYLIQTLSGNWDSTPWSNRQIDMFFCENIYIKRDKWLKDLKTVQVTFSCWILGLKWVGFQSLLEFVIEEKDLGPTLFST